MENEKSKVFTPQKRFLANLGRIFDAEASGDISVERLRKFGSHLAKLEEHWKRQLDRRLSRLSRDHPLFHPVGLFGPMGMGRVETLHTRTLCWLLNHEGEHQFGDVLVKSLLRLADVRRPDSVVVDLVEAERFYRNSLDEDCGRTDIWIEGHWSDVPRTRRWALVVEAKVDSGEGDHQLQRYDKELSPFKAAAWEIRKVFLTPKGITPSGRNQNWKPISFSILADAFLKQAATLKKKPGHAFLSLYLTGVFRDVLQLPTGRHTQKSDYCKLLGFLDSNTPQLPSQEYEMQQTTRALGFYLKHFSMMQVLSGEVAGAEATVAPGTPSVAIDQAAEVSRVASQQGADLLRAVAKEMMEYFNNLGCCHASIANRLSYTKKYWDIQLALRPKWGRRSRTHEVGAYLIAEDEDLGEGLCLYFWTKGSDARKSEIDLKKILKPHRVVGDSNTLDLYQGTVVFAKLPLSVDVEYGIDRPALLKKLKKALLKIRKRDVEKVLSVNA